jgi:ABC-type multidrug transport system fused ATPase/permease subunit
VSSATERKLSEAKPWRRLVVFVRPYMRRLIIGLIGMGIFTAVSMLPPLYLRFLVDNVIAAERWDLLPTIIVFITVSPALAWILRFFNRRVITVAGFRLIADMRMAIYRKVLSLSMRYHNTTSSGVIVNRLMDDVNLFREMVTGETVSIFIDLIVFVASFIIITLLSPLLAVMILGILVLYAITYRVFAKRIESAWRSYRTIYDRISERLQETVAGVRQVRLYNREPIENRSFLSRTDESLKFSLTSNMAAIGLNTATNAIAGYGSAVVAAFGAYMVLTGRLQYGDVLAINTYIFMALSPAVRFTTLAGQLSETRVSMRRIVEILDEGNDITSQPGAPPMPKLDGKVEFRDVHFRYVPDVPLYEGLTITVEAGTTVALVGHTGCGKTTFTQLLMRQWDIQGGNIMIDGYDLRSVEVGSLRDLFGVVLQSPVVFDGTIAENIAYGAPQASREQIVAAAQAAEIYDTAMRLADGIDAVIGTNGVKLSVGEKQRLSIARAILTDPVILIMDEATSSLDSESEALIQRALNRVLVGRTSFVVAHRLSTIVGADLIVVMDNGKIVETGRHPELMRIENGHYRNLYEELRSSVQGAEAGDD